MNLHLFFSLGFGADQAQERLLTERSTGSTEPQGDSDAVPQQAPAVSAVAFSMKLQELGVPLQKPGASDSQKSDLPQPRPLSNLGPSATTQTGESSAQNGDSGHAETKEDNSADGKKDSVPLDPTPVAHSYVLTTPGFANAAVYSAIGVAPEPAQSPGKPIAEVPPAPLPAAHLLSATVSPRHIDLTVPNDDGHQVDVRISQRGGEVQVTVRTPDSALAYSLRHHLPELSENLSRTGLRGEFFEPAQSQSSGEREKGQTSHDNTQQQSEQNQPEQKDQFTSGDRAKNKGSGSFAEMIHAEKRNKN